MKVRVDVSTLTAEDAAILLDTEESNIELFNGEADRLNDEIYKLCNENRELRRELNAPQLDAPRSMTNKIQAIKALRQISGCGLKFAKEFIEAVFADQLPQYVQEYEEHAAQRTQTDTQSRKWLDLCASFGLSGYVTQEEVIDAARGVTRIRE
jgi:hypothetical protein